MMYLIIQSFLKLDFVLNKLEISVSKTRTGGRFKRERTYVYLRLIYVVVWQKPTTNFCKAIIFQLKVNFKKHMHAEVALGTSCLKEIE